MERVRVVKLTRNAQQLWARVLSVDGETLHAVCETDHCRGQLITAAESEIVSDMQGTPMTRFVIWS